MTVLSSPNGTRFMRRRISLIGIGCNYLYWSRTCETAASSSSLRRTRESRIAPPIIGRGGLQTRPLSARPNPWMPDQVGHDGGLFRGPPRNLAFRCQNRRVVYCRNRDSSLALRMTRVAARTDNGRPESKTLAGRIQRPCTTAALRGLPASQHAR